VAEIDIKSTATRKAQQASVEISPLRFLFIKRIIRWRMNGEVKSNRYRMNLE
jgi:hypothetical protein